MLDLSLDEMKALCIVELKVKKQTEKWRGPSGHYNWKKTGLSTAKFKVCRVCKQNLPTEKARAAFDFLVDNNKYYKEALAIQEGRLNSSQFWWIKSFDLFMNCRGIECAMGPWSIPQAPSQTLLCEICISALRTESSASVTRGRGRQCPASGCPRSTQTWRSFCTRRTWQTIFTTPTCWPASAASRQMRRSEIRQHKKNYLGWSQTMKNQFIKISHIKEIRILTFDDKDIPSVRASNKDTLNVREANMDILIVNRDIRK